MTGPGKFARLLPFLLSLAIVAVAGVVLYRSLSGIEPRDVIAGLAAIPASDIALAAALTGLTLLALAVYEVAMLRYVAPGIGAGRPFLTALVAYPIGHAVGFGALSGGAIRYRSYAAAGLPVIDVGKIVVLSVMPYAAGLGVLCGASLALDPQDSAPLLGIEPRVAAAAGVALLLAHLAYIIAVWHLRGPIGLRWFRLELPGPRLTAIQYGLGLAEALCGIAVLYVLLPAGADMGFLSFAAVYVIAVFVGLLSSVPAGLGVFESMLLLMLRDLPPQALLGSVLAYRMIFELVPLCAAVTLFVGWEARRWPVR